MIIIIKNGRKSEIKNRDVFGLDLLRFTGFLIAGSNPLNYFYSTPTLHTEDYFEVLHQISAKHHSSLLTYVKIGYYNTKWNVSLNIEWFIVSVSL